MAEEANMTSVIAPPEDNNNEGDPTKELPEYVCCVVTEGVWTYFGAALLIVVLFTIATLKYCKKYLAKPRFHQKGHKLHLRSVLYDDRGAVSTVRAAPVSAGKDFISYCAQRRKHRSVDGIEFRKAAEGVVKPSSAITALHHKGLNHNKWSIPYEKNRVKLILDSESRGNDYINASRVRDYRGDDLCIVSQGPLENTVSDFWRLVWQEGVDQVVMLTRTFEFIKIMCVQYWPPLVDKPEEYEGFKVVVTKEESHAQYKIRHMSVTRNGETRQITHYHLHGWMAYAPPPPNVLLQVRRRLLDDYRNPINKDQPAAKFRIEDETERLKDDDSDDEEVEGIMSRRSLRWPKPIVNCSDGGYRSGMFAAVLDCLAMAEEINEVDVYAVAKRLMGERRSLLTDPEHLRYVYDVVEDEMLCGETGVELENILAKLQAKSKRSDGDRLNDYEREHKLLDSLIPRFTIGDCAAGHRAENRAKNRNVLVVPPDSYRPYLTSTVGGGSGGGGGGDAATDYVNAVFVDGHRRADEFVVTEWPMSNTSSQFWSLAHDFDLRTIVVLNQHKHSAAMPGNLAAFPPFWPQQQEGKVNYGPIFCVEQKSCRSFQDKFTVWQLNLMKQDISPKKFAHADMKQKDLNSLSNLLKSLQAPPKQVTLFQIHCWPNSHKVPNSTLALVDLIKEVDRWRSESAGRDGDPGRVLVVSSDGYSRCGIYCAAAACLEQVCDTGKVDVFQAVKTVRKSRPKLVANPTEYKYCYDVVLHYVLNYLNGEIGDRVTKTGAYESVGEEERS